MSNYTNPYEVKQEIEEFVESSCQLENDETEEDLVESLYNKVFNI